MIKENSKVRVEIAPNDSCHRILRKYIGKVMTVKRVKTIKSASYYELKGAVSSAGIPYAFDQEYLTEL